MTPTQSTPPAPPPADRPFGFETEYNFLSYDTANERDRAAIAHAVSCTLDSAEIEGMADPLDADPPVYMFYNPGQEPFEFRAEKEPQYWDDLKSAVAQAQLGLSVESVEVKTGKADLRVQVDGQAYPLRVQLGKNGQIEGFESGKQGELVAFLDALSKKTGGSTWDVDVNLLVSALQKAVDDMPEPEVSVRKDKARGR